MSKETEPIVENTDQTNSEQEMDSQNDEIIVIKENKSRPNDESNDLNLDKINDLLTEERNNSNNESIDAQNGSSQSELEKVSQKRTNRTYVQILHEMFPNRNAIRYVEEGRSGPAHSPLFTIAVHVNGLVFHGIARTKQSARHEAAKQAIHCLTQHSLPQSQSLNTRSYYQRSQQLGVNRRPNPYGNYDRRTPFINRLQSNFTDYRHGLPHYESQPFPELQHEDDYRYDTEYRDNSDYDFYYYNRYNRDQWLGDRPLLYYREPRPMPQPTQIYYYPSPHRQPIVSQNQSLELYPQSVNTSPTDASALNSVNKSSDDFTVDDYNDDNFVEFKECSADKSDDSIEDNKSDEEQELIQKPLDKKERIILRVMSEKPVHQNPVSVIHELHPDAKWDCVGSELTSKKQSIIFKMKLQLPIADKSFIGTGRTKKLAKSDAASKALLNLYNISINLQNADNPESYAPKSTVQIAQEPLFLKQDIANRIGDAVMLKCNEVWDKLTDIKKWIVLSAIVLTDESNIDFIDVICLTSGTKCVKGDSLSMNGYALNDCHAEILARRCLLSYIYAQIEKLIDNNFIDKPEFILERREDTYGFRLKKNIKVNLFISTAPCGDSRVFSPKEENESDAHPNRVTRGVLRAKIEGGEGTIPVKREAILTWDGILQGHQRLQFMSCSDKIALWNVVGLQGALLSHMIEPIYLESVVLGSLFNYEHLIRALHGRLNLNFDSNSLKGLPDTYQFNKSKVAKCQLKEDLTRQLIKAPNYAINWIKFDEKPEVISTDSGRIHVEGGVSRLAKRSLFARFCSLLGQNCPTLPTCQLAQNIPVIYRDGKTSSVDYQRAKTQCMQTFQEQNLGNWIQVPPEIDLFRL